MTEFVMWGTRKGDPDWMEDIITTNRERQAEARAWAEANGFDRIRTSEIDMTTKPNFGATVRL